MTDEELAAIETRAVWMAQPSKLAPREVVLLDFALREIPELQHPQRKTKAKRG